MVIFHSYVMLVCQRVYTQTGKTITKRCGKLPMGFFGTFKSAFMVGFPHRHRLEKSQHRSQKRCFFGSWFNPSHGSSQGFQQCGWTIHLAMEVFAGKTINDWFSMAIWLVNRMDGFPGSGLEVVSHPLKPKSQRFHDDIGEQLACHLSQRRHMVVS